MATYFCKRNEKTALAQSVFAPMYTLLDTQSPTAQNYANAVETKTMLETGLLPKYGGKDSDVYTFGIDETVVYKATRREIIDYADKVIATKVHFDALNTAWLAIRPVDKDGKDNPAWKVADKPKIEKGTGTRVKVEKVA
jgi:hypothetical protein